MGALDDDQDFAAPVTLRAELVGEPEGILEYADDADGGDEQAADDGAGGVGSDAVLWWALGAAGVLLLVGAAFALGRRGRGDAS